jgi:hypothetical protein
LKNGFLAGQSNSSSIHGDILDEDNADEEDKEDEELRSTYTCAALVDTY